MAEQSNFDIVIIGGGQAAFPLAKGLAKAGKTVAVIERKHLGGSCINFGCTPTKAAIASARVAHLARRASEFGINVTGVEPYFPAVLKRARDIALVSRNGMQKRFDGAYDVVLVRGHARLDGRDGPSLRVRVSHVHKGAPTGDEDIILAGQVVIDAGSRTLVPPIEGLDSVDFIHPGNWLERETLPKHLIMIGGSYVGLEMGQFYRRMGSEVTIVSRSERIIEFEEEETSSALQDVLTAEGMKIINGHSASRVRRVAGKVTVELSPSAGGSSNQVLTGSDIFLATGRKPNTDDLGLETLGVETVPGGFIKVNEGLATSAEGVWAVGDIRGGPLFTHAAWDDYRIVLSQITGDGSRTTDRIVPYAIFTDPELGRVGMTEAQALEKGISIKTQRYEMEWNAKAYELGETQGFIKVIADADTGRIVGATVLAREAAELVHIFVQMMNDGSSYNALEEAVQIHPTLAEGIQSAVSGEWRTVTPAKKEQAA